MSAVVNLPTVSVRIERLAQAAVKAAGGNPRTAAENLAQLIEADEELFRALMAPHVVSACQEVVEHLAPLARKERATFARRTAAEPPGGERLRMPASAALTVARSTAPPALARVAALLPPAWDDDEDDDDDEDMVDPPRAPSSPAAPSAQPLPANARLAAEAQHAIAGSIRLGSTAGLLLDFELPNGTMLRNATGIDCGDAARKLKAHAADIAAKVRWLLDIANRAGPRRVADVLDEAALAAMFRKAAAP